MKVKDMVLVDGQWACLKCLERKFLEIKNPHSYSTFIKDHDITEDGIYKFIYVCANCNINLVEYDDMKRKGRV